MITLIACTALVLSSAVIVSLNRFPSPLDNLLALINIALAQIIGLSIVLSETFGIGTSQYLAAHLVVLAISLLTWWYFGRPGLFAPYKPADPASSRSITLTIMSGVVIFLAAALIIINIEFFLLLPSMNKDALSYHIPRAYFWLQQGSLHHLPYPDFRWTEFPPNSSIILAWMMAARIGYAWLLLPQVLGAIMMALAVYRLTILCGGNRISALAASLVCLGFPAVIYQMGTAGNDLLVAGLITTSAYFVAAALKPNEDSRSVNRAATQAGLAVGVGAGAKLTFILISPGLALTALGAWALLGRNRAMGRFLRLGIGISAGFLLLGSYNYIQNYVKVGDLTQSVAQRQVLSRMPAELYAPVRNLAFSIHQTLSWHGLQHSYRDPLARAHANTTLWLDRKLGLGMASVSGFDEGGHLTHPSNDENIAGYGVVGFLALILSPFVAVFAVVRFIRQPVYQDLVRAGLIVTGWVSLIIFCANAPWGQTQARYLISFIPLILAPVVSIRIGSIRWTNALSILVGAYAIWVMLYCIAIDPQRTPRFEAGYKGLSPLNLYLGGRWSEQPNIIRSIAPPSQAIGYTGRIDSWAFVLPRELPAYRFILVRTEDIDQALASGRVAAVVSELLQNVFPKALPLPGTILPPRQALHVLDPERVLMENLNRYSLTVQRQSNTVEMPVAAAETFSNLNSLFPIKTSTIRLLLPDSPVRLGNGGLSVEIPLSMAFPARDIESVACNGHELAFSEPRDVLRFSLAPDQVRRDTALQDCAIKLHHEISVGLVDTGNVAALPQPWIIRAMRH